MPKKSSERTHPRQCVFCDNTASSCEHIWSEWTHKLFETTSNSSHHGRYLEKSDNADGSYVAAGHLLRPGDVSTVKVRVVCTECNNGWMSRLEEEVRPFLERMIQDIPCKLESNPNCDPLKLGLP